MTLPLNRLVGAMELFRPLTPVGARGRPPGSIWVSRVGSWIISEATKTWQYLGESGDIQSVIHRADGDAHHPWRLPIGDIFICVKLRLAKYSLINYVTMDTFILIHGISRTGKKVKKSGAGRME